jgi:hypothetical protein
MSDIKKGPSKSLTIHAKLVEVQAALKAPKSQRNNFGKYSYRKAEDILESVKPLLHSRGLYITLEDDVASIGERFYIRATATIYDGADVIQASALAREEEVKKGMDGSQITGAASSYARKYALNGLFAIDDTADADGDNPADKIPSPPTRSTPAPAGPPAAKASDAPQAEKVGIMDKAVNYIKGQSDKHKAFDSIMKKYESELSAKQITGLRKFVR